MYVSLYEQGFSALANMYMSLAETLISIGRFLQLLEREPAIAFGVGDAPPTCRGAVELRDVCFHYPHAPDAPVLQGISFVATPGTVVALVGESGAGKSTVGRLLERFYDPQGGALLLDGVDSASWSCAGSAGRLVWSSRSRRAGTRLENTRLGGA